jgi:hypothetical protein
MASFMYYPVGARGDDEEPDQRQPRDANVPGYRCPQVYPPAYKDQRSILAWRCMVLSWHQLIHCVSALIGCEELANP